MPQAISTIFGVFHFIRQSSNWCGSNAVAFLYRRESAWARFASLVAETTRGNR